MDQVLGQHNTTFPYINVYSQIEASSRENGIGGLFEFVLVCHSLYIKYPKGRKYTQI